MTIGQLARKALGNRFQACAALYRAIFVDVKRIAEFIAEQLPPSSKCLDIGGRDGAIINHLLKIRPDVHVTMTDIACSLGSFIDPAFINRVDIHPSTAARDLIGRGKSFDAITICDVVHHVPERQRIDFWRELRDVCEDTSCRLIIVKDISPGTMRGLLGLASDRFITGDQHVTLVTPDVIEASIVAAFKEQQASFEHAIPDRANYCVVARLIAQA